MNHYMGAALFAIVTILLSGLVYSLKRDADVWELKVRAAEQERNKLEDAAYSLENDIKRTVDLQGELDDQIEESEVQLQLLGETLIAIQEKLKDTERLSQAVTTLKQEFDGLQLDVVRFRESDR